MNNQRDNQPQIAKPITTTGTTTALELHNPFHTLQHCPPLMTRPSNNQPRTCTNYNDRKGQNRKRVLTRPTKRHCFNSRGWSEARPDSTIVIPPQTRREKLCAPRRNLDELPRTMHTTSSHGSTYEAHSSGQGHAGYAPGTRVGRATDALGTSGGRAGDAQGTRQGRTEGHQGRAKDAQGETTNAPRTRGGTPRTRHGRVRETRRTRHGRAGK